MRIKLLAIVLLALFASGAAWAQKSETRPGNPEQKDRMQRQEMRAERMNNFFTAEQQEQIKTIRLESTKKIQPLRNELNELEARQQTLRTAEKPDMKAIYANIDKMSELKAGMEKIRAQQHQDIRSLLTEEQKLKFDAMRGKMRDRRNEGFSGRKSLERNAG